MTRSDLSQVVASNDPQIIARALGHCWQLSGDDAKELGAWIRRTGGLHRFKRRRGHRRDIIDRRNCGPVDPFESVLYAIDRDNPHDIGNAIERCTLDRYTIKELAGWIVRFFGPKKIGRPAKDSITQTMEAAWLRIHTRGMEGAQISERFSRTSRRGQEKDAKYSGISRTSIYRARARLHQI